MISAEEMYRISKDNQEAFKKRYLNELESEITKAAYLGFTEIPYNDYRWGNIRKEIESFGYEIIPNTQTMSYGCAELISWKQKSKLEKALK